MKNVKRHFLFSSVGLTHIWKVAGWVSGNGTSNTKLWPICDIMLLRHELYLSAHHLTCLSCWELAQKAGVFHNRGRTWQRGVMGCCYMN